MIRGSEFHFSLDSSGRVYCPIAPPATQKQVKERGTKGEDEGKKKKKSQAKSNGESFLSSLGRKACNAPRKQ